MRNPLFTKARTKFNNDRTYRGGSWNYDAKYSRVFRRDWSNAPFRSYVRGFRLFRSQEKK